MLSKSEYSQTFASKNFISGKYFQITYQPINMPSKLGLAIAKKNHKLAVKRNLLKRIAREVFRTSLIKNCNIVVLSKKFGKVNNKLLFTDLQNIFAKLPQ